MLYAKKHIRQFLSIVFATMILMSTSGFSIYTHSCSLSGTKNYAVFIPAQKCGNEKLQSNHNNCCNEIEKKSCCDNKSKKRKNTDCCKNHKEIKKLDTKTVVTERTLELKCFKNLVSAILFANTILAFFNINNNFGDFLLYKVPPSKSTLEYLSIIQVYII